MSELGPAWRVRRTAGLLLPGFTKRFDERGQGMTYLAGVPIGRFDVVVHGDRTAELVYRRWPIVDVLETVPATGGSIRSAGFVRLPGARRVRFCSFRMQRDVASAR